MPVAGFYRIDEAALNALPDEAFLALRKTGALPLAYAQLMSMNQFAMLPKAARMQAQIRERLQAKAANQEQSLAGLDFLFAPDNTIKFS